MSGMIGYALGYEDGRSSAEVSRGNHELIERAFYGTRSATVDQSYIDRLHAALADANANSAHNYKTADQFHDEALWWKDKANQFRNEALYWRDQKFAPAKAKAKALREENAVLRDENAVLLARLEERDPDLAEEQAAHDETFKEGQSLHRFRVIATSLIDALLAGRANRPEFAELLNLAKDAADTIERGDLFTALAIGCNLTIFRDLYSAQASFE
jgi:hypothetical protein